MAKQKTPRNTNIKSLVCKYKLQQIPARSKQQSKTYLNPGLKLLSGQAPVTAKTSYLKLTLLVCLQLQLYPLHF